MSGGSKQRLRTWRNSIAERAPGRRVPEAAQATGSRLGRKKGGTERAARAAERERDPSAASKCGRDGGGVS
jgi:hypothetical protein